MLANHNILQYQCTCCRKFFTKISEHPLLKVIVCEECALNFESVKDKFHSICIWCYSSQDLLECKECNYKFCDKCLSINLSKDNYSSIVKTDWMCLVCKPEPIEPLVKWCSQAKEVGQPSLTQTSPVSDLDFILNIYDKQIKASLEMEDASVPAIISEINSIDSTQTLQAVSVFKKCLNAFASDLANFEIRLHEAEKRDDKEILSKMTELLKIVAQHHIFNRLAHPIARIKEEGFVETTSLINKGEKDIKCQPKLRNIESVKVCKVLPSKCADEQDTKVQDMLTRIKNICDRQRKLKKKQQYDDDDGCSGHNSSLNTSTISRNIHYSRRTGSSRGRKRNVDVNADEEEDFNYSVGGDDLGVSKRVLRTKRKLTAPSWLQDFKVDRDDEADEIEEKDALKENYKNNSSNINSVENFVVEDRENGDQESYVNTNSGASNNYRLHPSNSGRIAIKVEDVQRILNNIAPSPHRSDVSRTSDHLMSTK